MKSQNIFFLMVPLLMAHASLFADDASTPSAEQGLWQTFIMIAIALAFFYLILWRPEQKRRKALEEVRQSIKQGDKVLAMGIIGTVSKIQDQTVVLKLYDGAKLEVLKAAITEVLPEDFDSGKSGSEDVPGK